ncbi:NAD-dependent epimerase/dehydratase family protein [Gymnodinialimonas hymeniacidonis]|uniref:NAD-dependent epimerase/dehydratase family protein n=1 Tax=Gymnodinialimonas hymeniacidonis TaxID=3126508 RepID=UPI0034C66559
MSRTILVTGSSGFIGFHLCQRLLNDGWRVIGIDAMTDYYDVGLKEGRLAQLDPHGAFTNVTARIEDPGVLHDLFETHRPEAVIHLAAQAGVRYSIENPESYVQANLIGTFRLLEAMRAFPPKHSLLASTSSAYGANTDMPYAEQMKTDHQMSFYAATKKSNEVMAHSYAHLYDLPVTMFRFFTVYGPWGRPDMAPHLFTSAIFEGRPIKVFNHGEMSRDFTYVTDLVDGIVRLIDAVPGSEPVEGDSLSPVAPHRIVNIGNSDSVPLMEFIGAIEAATGIEAEKNFMEMQPGDVPATWADASLLQHLTQYKPKTPVSDGVAQFVAWYRDYYQV